MQVREGMESAVGNCEHYVRRCLLNTPCCGKMYPCRLCHDRNEDHEVNRFEVEILVCTQCRKDQPVSSHCKYCGILFGLYSCTKCRVFDDNDHGQFHCEECGLCRKGGRENFFHCKQCGICLTKSIKDSHKCREESGKDKCPVCFDSIHTATEPSLAPKCGHLIHMKCHRLIMEFGHRRCPYCNQDY
ncbi:RING finger and CHY zinc finger domain-containing protein 1-like [Rhopilema esculentum]|uniref:RING finger and CHY zinc finger domain-containing protein 1-like n=1 Tax=Rhopilema esculentum TaxID=499914 RepID=UPI0031E44479